MSFKMRRKIFKYISAISLAFAGLTLCAHSLLPHDHHSDNTLPAREEKCPASDNNSGHSSGFPIHCHAFNDLTSEKARHYHNTLNFQLNYIAVSSFSDISSFDLQATGFIIIDLQKPTFEPFALELYLLRAPPSLV